ncbi:thiamine phosphate synthase [uncultured Campylobacter sp.]|uniref:thiamine phosphate synthase n=1 Tax=uncultured Campylobacter sp. TaxID=218934 RepID=UPI002632131A|nr:thiamine phosphate synthase [uncultured Campylobacter sp.]
MLDFELASRITIITNRALCGGEAALLARIADFAATGVGEIVVREKDLSEKAYAALFGKILLACESGFCADKAFANVIFADEACTAKFGKIQALEGELDVSAAYADKILLCERDADEVSPKKLHLGGGKSEICADAAHKYGVATDETRPKNSACVLDEILSENFTGTANCADDSAPGEISLRGAASETKPADGTIQSAEDAEIAQGRGNTESMESAYGAEKANGTESVKEAENSQGAKGTQSAERARRPPTIFVHNFADFTLRKGERNLWLPLGVLRSFSAAHGAEFLRANFKKLVASCHSEAEAREALELGASAICLSHIFATDCKAGLAPRGLNLIRAVREFFAGEIYALGGITPRNFASVLRAGADRIAVMSSAMAARDASDFIRKFKK